ncbi:uncharacterized protein A1O5_02056 [Cladophialophora psammophila CBS 110553]|uniref:ABM domain-containing protein n=1 Tax=Cladophialophora psammophila CBS 110553 TaxID=1182543 RepID=W9XDH4_9EURO|nr:uncharacterized protein A1O5_02056 [Cladophialophora psammophila CBS 110553]EXJ75360.1 hypothetical protein A1O5_02056 [Cladophialophora psammophila CBS 110553]
MAVPVTELIMLPVKAGSDISQAIQTALSVASKRPGFQRAFWGQHVESTDKVDLWIDWDSLEYCIAYTKSQECEQGRAALQPILNGAPSVLHAQFASRADEIVATSPVMEVAYFFSAQPAIEKGFEKVSSVLAKSTGFRASSSGLTIEDIGENPGDEKHKAFVALIGWDSVEAHMQAIQTKEAVDSAPHLTNHFGTVQMHHTRFQPLNV